MEEKEMGVGCIKKEYRDIGQFKKIDFRAFSEAGFIKSMLQKSKKGDDQVKYKKRTFLNW